MMEKMQKKDIKSMEQNTLEREITNLGEKPYRARQIFQWMHQKFAAGFDEMTNLPKDLRIALEEQYTCNAIHILEKKVSALDGTEKYLFRLWDSQVIESVLLKYSHGNTVCISSQAGCRMGCRFCASAIGGLARSLSPGEMLGQVYEIQKEMKEPVSNVVVMGTGEPLDNFDNLVTFIRLLSCKEGRNMSQRNITVSTCGLTPRIYELADCGLKITLALSLHAATQEQREALMPIAARYPLEQVMEACAYYFEKTGRRISYEYSLIRGVNDSREDMMALIRLLKPLGGHLNLININPVAERDFQKIPKKDLENMKNLLEKNGINVTIRREMGKDIDGACGQLRRKYISEVVYRQ